MGNILKVVRHPDPFLRERSGEVDPETISFSDVQQFIDDMIATMWQEDGVGLAAPQVGHHQRIIVITQDKEAIPLINPEITYRSFRKDIVEEGCLSVPGFYGSVRRSISIHVRALNRNGEEVRFKAEGLAARIVQHEVDHLDGILFIDRAKRVVPVQEAAKL